MTPLPKTMKAWVIRQPGDARDVLELEMDWPTPPSPKGGDIVIRISYAALNPLDIVVMHMRRPWVRDPIPGADFVGEVVQAGPSSSVREGTIVSGTIPTMRIMSSGGTLAEYVSLPSHMVAAKPQGLAEDSAVAIMGVPGQTSAIVLRGANLQPGDKVLVNGASGGVGCVLMQVLRAKGMHVTAVCSKKNDALVRRLGAEDVVDYTAHESIYAHLSGHKNAPFDAVIDCIGDEQLYKKSPGYLTPKGQFTTFAGGLLLGLKLRMLPVWVGGTPRKFSSLMNSQSGAGAQEVAGWIEKGWVKEAVIDSSYDMGSAVEALEKMASRHAAGKIVVKVG